MESRDPVFFPWIPTTWTAGSASSESGRLNQQLQLPGQRRAIGGGYAGGKANVMKRPLRVIQPKQKGADNFAPGGIMPGTRPPFQVDCLGTPSQG
jgi:hypothetical protein